MERREGARGRFLLALSFRSLYPKTEVQVAVQNWDTELWFHLQLRSCSWAQRPSFPVVCSFNNLDRSLMKSHLAPSKMTKGRNPVGREGRPSRPLCCSVPALPLGNHPQLAFVPPPSGGILLPLSCRPSMDLWQGTGWSIWGSL